MGGGFKGGGELRMPLVLSLEFLSAGSFDFVPLLQGGLTKTQVSWRISDHYPLWVEFSVSDLGSCPLVAGGVRLPVCQRRSTTGEGLRASSYAPSSLGCAGGTVSEDAESRRRAAMKQFLDQVALTPSTTTSRGSRH